MFGIFKNKKKDKVSDIHEVTKVDDGGFLIEASEFIPTTFITLTSKTYPYGDEDGLVEEMLKLKLFPEGIQKDAHGNYYYKIGESRTMFTSHLDTACKDQSPVKHKFEKSYIKTDGTTILGADDKAGVTIMLYMMRHNVPGLYYFFIGEEVGCVGSGLAAKYINFKGNYDRCVSFDRRGTDSVITYQSSSRCCSDEFANQLAKELNKSGLSYKKDDTGIYTDSAEFTSDIPECTNLSVGYYKEHTVDESQDIDHLTQLAEACLRVDWESLITKRDPSKTEYKSWSYSGYGNYGGYGSYTRNNNSKNWRNRDYDYGWGSSHNFKTENDIKKDLKKTYGYHDDWYENEKEFKKTRRGKKNKGGRSFYDNGGELIDISTKDDLSFTKISIYEWVKFKFFDNSLSKEEMEIVKEQYLDMDDADDRKFYETILKFTHNL